MEKKKYFFKVVFMMLIFCSVVSLFNIEAGFVVAEDGNVQESFVVYDENNEVIAEKSSIEEGDVFVTKDFYEYEVYKIEGQKGYAKKIGRLNVPSIKRGKVSTSPNQFSKNGGNIIKKICLYMTHNDESYTPSDGYDSIYGAGGIHDVASAFKDKLENKGIKVVLDQTLHIPHNSSAYSRSSVTANRLLTKENPDAMFDIHRDGVSKSYYYTKQGNKDLSKIRIVVGKSNPNFNDNYKFAQNVFAIGNSMYPWLFSDIYCGKGHYNQALQTTDLLFEMGTYLIEKEYVMNSLPYLAEVVNTALYASKEESDGDIVVDEKVPETSSSPIVNENNENKKSSNLWIWIVGSVVLVGGAVITLILIIDENNKKKSKKHAKINKKTK